MGLTFSLLFEKQFGRYQMQILMLGLDAAGKTTILYKLKLGEIVSSVPTIGFNMETLQYKNLKFTVWDLGGCNMRKLWKHYYDNTQALIFVVDSFDKDRIDDARKEMMKMLDEEKLRDIPVLVFANKQDLNGVMNIQEITEKLGLVTLQRDWYIQGTTALTGDGLQDGLNWLQSRIKNQ